MFSAPGIKTISSPLLGPDRGGCGVLTMGWRNWRRGCLVGMCCETSGDGTMGGET